MAINDLLRNITVNSTCGSPNSKPSGVFLRKKLSWLTIVAALAVPMYGCEGDSTTNKSYYGEGGSGGGDTNINSCNAFCQWETDECLLPGKDYQSNVKWCVDECQKEASTYDSAACFSCAKSYDGTQEEKCGAFKQCIDK